MKKKWIRKVAVFLTLCLLMDDRIAVSYMKPIAAGAEGISTGTFSADASEDALSTAVVSGNDAAGNSAVENGASNSIAIGNGSSENGASGNGEAGNGSFTAGVSGNDLAADETAAAETAAEDLPMLFAASAEDTFPATIEAYLEVSGQTEFVISTKQDFINAQTVCADARSGGFAGKTLTIGSPKEGGTTWNLTTGMNGFAGIGTKESPFKGTLKCGYDSGVDFSINKPIIKWLGDGAVVTQLRIKSTASCAGIAENVSGNVTIADNIYLDGSFGDNWSAAGVIVTNISDGSTVNVRNITVGAGAGITIYGTDAGVIAANIGNSCTVTIDNVPASSGYVSSLSGSGAGGVIAGNIGEGTAVTMSNVSLATGGAFYVQGGTVGTLAGNIGSGSSVTVSNVSGMIPQVSGTIAGALAGTLGSGAEVSLGEGAAIGNSGQIAVLGTQAAGGYYGVVTGSHTWNLTDSDKVVARAIANSGVSFAGQFAGKFISDGTAGTLTVAGGNSITVQVSGTGSSGGIVGLCGENMNIAVPAGTFTITGTIEADEGGAGGVAGVLENPAMELADFVVNANVKGKYAGGLIGEMQGGKCIIRDVTVGKVTGTAGAGGLVGNVLTGAVEIQGTASVPEMPTGCSNCGLAVGSQTTSLIYFSEVEGLLSGASQIVHDGADKEIGSYGGVFRNQAVAGGKMIGDGTLEKVGVINENYTVAKAGDWYQLTQAADFEALAIVLGTEGAFGTSAFTDYTDWGNLLTASYNVTRNTDISYNKTGIVTLNRNDKLDAAHGFGGRLQGENNTVTITQNISVPQNGGGLFTALTGDAEISRLVFDGTVENAQNVGGIAYTIAGGRSLTLTDVTMQKHFVNCTEVVGGIAAQKPENTPYTLTADKVKLFSAINAGNMGKYSGFITELSKADVDINNVTLGGTLESTAAGEAGGFFGYTWSDIGGTIRNVSVQPGTVYTAAGSFGALWNTLKNNAADSKHVTLEKINLNGLTVNAGADKAYNSLLVRNAADLVADIVDYNCRGCTVNNPGAFFDEVAGMSRTGEVIPTLPSNSGIISLHSSNANFPAYHYDYQATYNGGNGARFNRSTIYYYDLFQYLEDEDGNVITTIEKAGGADSFVLDTAGKVLLWNASQMANSTIRGTFAKYYSDHVVPSATNQTGYFKGTLDLSNISYYPTPKVDNGTYTGQDNARIIFGAKTASLDMGTWKLGNEAIEASQHYGLQAGLFVNELGNMYLNVSDITFSGTIANLDFRSGVILTGEVGMADGCTIKNITLDDLWVADYTTATATGGHRIGLLISKISGNTAIFENIEMVNYDVCRTSNVKAAATLIAYAGGDSNTNITLSFKNMKIADDKDGGNLHNGDALAHASFICNYDYTDNIQLYTGSGIYLFSEEDFNTGDATLGNELDEDTEFSDTSNKVLETMAQKNLGTEESYIPYICHDPACYQFQSEYIEVNPKTGDILKGCGTYEDPYIIENEKQFLTLYRYLGETAENPNDYQYKTFYELGAGWKIIKPGTDETFCSVKHNVTYGSSGFTGNGAEDAVKFGEEGFPTPQELSHSYFQVAKDINLSGIVNTTYHKIAEEFIGFGSRTVPFAGVWDGKGHTITLPVRDSMHTNETYGFIQYARGVVVKDLHLLVDGNTSEAYEAKMAAKISGTGGSVIGTILGGDNIIDNVTADVEMVVSGAGVIVGGYVGLVKKGGLILRNVNDTSLKKFSTNQWNENLYIGAIAGKVEDGYVLYEGAGSTGNCLWEGTGGNTLYPAIPDYRILNGDRLKADAAGMDAVLSGTNVTVNIPSAAGLQIMSMAMNADALNVRPSDWRYNVCGYTEQTRSRKAAYGDIGCTTQTADYLLAAKYDNVMSYSTDADKAYAYPYLYQYMGITGDEYLSFYVEENTKGYSILNPATLLGGNAYCVTWELAANRTFDMSQYGNSFRGIGALYQAGGGYGGTFHGNFHGNGSRIHLNLQRKIRTAESTNSEVTLFRVGLFNTLYGTEEKLYQVEADFKNTESSEADLYNCFEIRDFKLSGKIDNSTETGENIKVQAGGVAANIDSGNYIFRNISVEGANPLTIGESNAKNIDYAGGLIGMVEAWKTRILIDNCNFTGTQDNGLLVQGSHYTGGFVGYEHGSSGSILKITDSRVEYADVTSLSRSAGGMVGRNRNSALIIEGSSDNYTMVRHCTVVGHQGQGNETAQPVGGFVGSAEGDTYIRYAGCEASAIGMETLEKPAESAGGLIGTVNGYFSIADISCKDISVSAHNNIGGVVGKALGSKRNVIKNAVITDLKTAEISFADDFANGIGGIVGRNDTALSIQDITVSGTRTGDTYSCSITGIEKRRKNNGGVGGVAGCHANNTLTIQNCTVDTVLVAADLARNSVSDKVLGAGGLVGFCNTAMNLAGDITVKNAEITAPEAGDAASKFLAAGGFIGVLGAKLTGDSTGASAGFAVNGNTIVGKQAGGLLGAVNNGQFVLSGVKVQNDSISSNQTAGGMFGYVSGNGEMRSENALVQNCVVTAAASGTGGCSAGGLAGVYEFAANVTAKYYNVSLSGNTIVVETAGDTLSDTEKDNIAVGGAIGKMGQSSQIGYILLDQVIVGEDNQIGVRKTGTTDVKLIRKRNENFVLSDSALPAASDNAEYRGAVDKLEEDYGYYVGSVVGVVESASVQFYMLVSNDSAGKFIAPVMTENPPVVDVGRKSNQGADAYRKYCHIIYGAEVRKAADITLNLADMKAETDKAKQTYTGKEDWKSLLTVNRVSQEATEIFETAYQTSYQFPETDYTIDFPILVYRVQDGTLQELMEAVSDVMTGVAGLPSCNMQYLSITAAPKLCDGAVITDGTGNKASVTVNMTNGAAGFTSTQYDGEKDGKLSFTELTYTYGWTDESGAHTKVFRIPVFVEEPILYSVHSKILEGKITSVDTMLEKGTSETEDSLIMANDSDYTLLLEYSYGSARKQMADGVAVDKVFYLQEENKPKSLPVGTQLLLIDVTNGNKAYYYTIEAANITKIKFTDFKDSNGNSYVNTSINRLKDVTDEEQSYYTDLAGHQLTGVGIERFLLTVLTNDENPQNTMYTIHSGINIADAGLASRFLLEENHKEETRWLVNSIPGLDVKLTGKGNETSVKGSISKAGGLSVKAQFALTASQLYWAEKLNGTIMDSSNSGKYLDIAFYLRDQDNNRVNLPGGTNFSYRYETEDGDYLFSNNKVIPDDALIYYYKDIRDAFGIDDFEYMMADIAKDTSVSVEYMLDFGGADLSNITEEKYAAWIELLRTANRDYPMGVGNQVDYYTEEVEANAAQELGFALKADELDQLGINTYPAADETNIIDAHVMFDFGDILKIAGTDNSVVVSKWSRLNYEVTYQIYKKTENGEKVIYEPYTDANPNPTPDITITATEGVVSSESGNGTLKAVYNLTEDQIANGNGETPVEGLVTFPCQIKLNTADLTEDLGNLTNYKIVATLTIKEPGDSGTGNDSVKTTSDFFIYTVTKLKLDL